MAYGSPSGGDNPMHSAEEQEIIESIPNYAPSGERPARVPTYVLKEISNLVGAMSPELRKYIFPALILGIAYMLVPESYKA